MESYEGFVPGQIYSTVLGPLLITGFEEPNEAQREMLATLGDSGLLIRYCPADEKSNVKLGCLPARKMRSFIFAMKP
ncbi:MAG: hypothetical protein HZA22_04535 [Nitrospirae bacterium]|nr:hypothetical protein [Nitrospirota bacterium]